jgi:hypothetical protein
MIDFRRKIKMKIQNIEIINSKTEIYSIPIVEREKVLLNARLLYPIVANQVKAFPVILPQRIPSVCLSSSAAFGSEMDIEIGTQLSFLSLTAFGIDDIADGAVGAYTHEQIEDLLTLYGHIVKLGGATDKDYPHFLQKFTTINDSEPGIQLANALVKICQKLKAFPSEKTYYLLFAKYLHFCLEGMRLELHWQQNFIKTKIYPTYEQYLNNGQVSIGMPAILAALLIMIAQPTELSQFHRSEFSTLEKLLDELLLNYGASTRLQNDLRSFEREKLEQKPNSISILMSSHNLSAKEAYERVKKAADTYLEKAYILLSLLPANFQIWGECTERLSLFAQDFYLVREFHDFSLEMLSQLVNDH